jgi:hypothetical protein
LFPVDDRVGPFVQLPVTDQPHFEFRHASDLGYQLGELFRSFEGAPVDREDDVSRKEITALDTEPRIAWEHAADAPAFPRTAGTIGLWSEFAQQVRRFPTRRGAFEFASVDGVGRSRSLRFGCLRSSVVGTEGTLIFVEVPGRAFGQLISRLGTGGAGSSEGGNRQDEA